MVEIEKVKLIFQQQVEPFWVGGFAYCYCESCIKKVGINDIHDHLFDTGRCALCDKVNDVVNPLVVKVVKANSINPICWWKHAPRIPESARPRPR